MCVEGDGALNNIIVGVVLGIVVDIVSIVGAGVRLEVGGGDDKRQSLIAEDDQDDPRLR